MNDEKAKELAQVLATGIWTHDYPISVEEAIALGLPVSTDMPEEVYKLMALYRQPAQKRPSVLYIPVPYLPPQRRERQL
jgi:ClpP class serine protease